MRQKWIEVVNNGSRAYSQGEYSIASELFTQVLVEIKVNLRQIEVLSLKNIEQIQEFALCSRLAGKALMENEQPHDAEKVYLSAIEKMKSLISNLNNPLPYRALIVTELKLLFYDLASFYATKKQLNNLHAFTEKNTPTLKGWAVELEMVSQSGINLN